MRKFVLSVLALGLCLPATLAHAQGDAPAQAPSLGGPAVPGVCLLSQPAVLANAKVGQAATARLKQIADAADAELKAARAPLDTEVRTLQAQQATMKPAEMQARRQALETRAQGLQQLADRRRQEIELTRQKAVAQIGGDEQSIIGEVYTAHNCGLLLDRNAVMGGNMSGDLTPDVVRGLDAKVATITFNRASLSAAGK